MYNLNQTILEGLIENTLVTPRFKKEEYMDRSAFNREFRRFTFNLGRATGKTTAITKVAQAYPHLNFLIIYRDGMRLSDKLSAPNIKVINISEYRSRKDFFYSSNVIIIEDSSTFNNTQVYKETFERMLESLNANHGFNQILIELG